MTIVASTTVTTWPQDAGLSGVLTDEAGSPVADSQVELWAQPFGGVFALVGAVTTDSTGAASTVHRPENATTYHWRVPGTTVQSPDVVVQVRPALTAKASSGNAALASLFSFSVSVAPRRDGTPVRLQQWSDTAQGWVAVRSETLDRVSGDPFTLEYQARRTGRLRYRVTLPADDGRLQVSSPEMPINIYQARVVSVHPTGDEYVTVRNTGRVSLNLKSWRLTNRYGRTLTLPTKWLTAGAYVRIHTGSGRARPTDIYLGRSATWGDSHDTARLFDTRSVLVDYLLY
ncbi:MAG: lamin tail domain-containing protein [Nocardioidaceae bacterium]